MVFHFCNNRELGGSFITIQLEQRLLTKTNNGMMGMRGGMCDLGMVVGWVCGCMGRFRLIRLMNLAGRRASWILPIGVAGVICRLIRLGRQLHGIIGSRGQTQLGWGGGVGCCLFRFLFVWGWLFLGQS